MRKIFCPVLTLCVVILFIPAIVYGWGSCTVEITGPRFICVGETITLTACGTPSGGSCSWSNTPGLSPSGCTATFKGLYNGDFWVTVTYSSGYDFKCSDVDMITVGGRDQDEDGHYAIGSCIAPADDCDDNDPAVHPGATETCDNKDNNCDGQVDEGLSTDADGDGHYTPDSCKTPKDDCNDNDPTIYPGDTELCDSKDNNCNGQVDEGFPVGTICSVGIGACERQGIFVCSGDGTGVVCNATPGEPSPEICDGIDNDCDGIIDEDCQRECPVPPLTPLTDPLAIRLEGGEVLVEGFLTQRMQEAVNCFRNAVRSAGGAINITSAYRSPEYNSHLREVWDRYYDLINEDTLLGTECDSLRNEITAAFERHRLVYRPGTRHATGIAIDASVTLPTGQNVDTLADSCNLYRPFSNDRVHFELRR